jgi:hypothetical protein
MPEETSPLKKKFPITIDGKDFVLSFPIAAFAKYKETTGIDMIAQIQKSASDGLTTEERVAKEMEKPLLDRMMHDIDLLWVGLLTYQPEVKREEVQGMVFPSNFSAIEEILVPAYMSAFQQAKPADAEAQRESPLAEDAAN